VNGRASMKQDHDTLRYGEGNDTVGDFEDLENVRGKSGVQIMPTGPRGLTRQFMLE
jgi:hypothetical protein